MIYVETSAFVPLQELQASDSVLLFTLSTENSLDVFVLNPCPLKNFWGWPWPAGGWPQTLDWRDTSGPPGIVGKPRRLSAGCYKALTNQPEGRRRSLGCMEVQQRQEAPGLCRAMLAPPLALSLPLLSVQLFYYADDKIHLQSSLQERN